MISFIASSRVAVVIVISFSSSSSLNLLSRRPPYGTYGLEDLLEGHHQDRPSVDPVFPFPERASDPLGRAGRINAEIVWAAGSGEKDDGARGHERPIFERGGEDGVLLCEEEGRAETSVWGRC